LALCAQPSAFLFAEKVAGEERMRRVQVADVLPNEDIAVVELNVLGLVLAVSVTKVEVVVEIFGEMVELNNGKNQNLFHACKASSAGWDL
jgi:hypothetical protein